MPSPLHRFRLWETPHTLRQCLDPTTCSLVVALRDIRSDLDGQVITVNPWPAFEQFGVSQEQRGTSRRKLTSVEDSSGVSIATPDA